MLNFKRFFILLLVISCTVRGIYNEFHQEDPAFHGGLEQMLFSVALQRQVAANQRPAAPKNIGSGGKLPLTAKEREELQIRIRTDLEHLRDMVRLGRKTEEAVNRELRDQADLAVIAGVTLDQILIDEISRLLAQAARILNERYTPTTGAN